jgi:hypothetical protein
MMEYRKCFICERSETSYNRLEVHHIFQGRGRRQLSDRYGLTVLLCRNCHTQSKYSAHQNADVARYLHRYGQEKAMREQGWTKDEFKAIFGKNYLD